MCGNQNPDRIPARRQDDVRADGTIVLVPPRRAAGDAQATAAKRIVTAGRGSGREGVAEAFGC